MSEHIDGKFIHQVLNFSTVSLVMHSAVPLVCFLRQEGHLEEGVDALRDVRAQWEGRPDHLVRAARHYEGAAQILIRHAVMTAREVRVGRGLCCESCSLSDDFMCCMDMQMCRQLWTQHLFL